MFSAYPVDMVSSKMTSLVLLLLLALHVCSCYGELQFSAIQTLPSVADATYSIATSASKLIAYNNKNSCIQFIPIATFGDTDSSNNTVEICSGLVTNPATISCAGSTCFALRRDVVGFTVFNESGIRLKSVPGLPLLSAIAATQVDSNTVLLYAAESNSSTVVSYLWTISTLATSIGDFELETDAVIESLDFSFQQLFIRSRHNVTAYNTTSGSLTLVFSDSVSPFNDVAVDPSTTLYVINTLCNCVTIFSNEVVTAGDFTINYEFINPTSLLSTGCELYVTDLNSIIMFDTKLYVSVETTPEKCEGLSDGSASVSVQGGQQPYNYMLTMPYIWKGTYNVAEAQSPNTQQNFSTLSAVKVQPFTVYQNGVLSNTFADWTWGTKNSADTRYSHSGTSSFSFYPQDFSAIYFHCDDCIDITEFAGFSFWVNAGSIGGQQLQICVSSSNAEVNKLKVLEMLGIPSFPLNKWIYVFYSFDPLPNILKNFTAYSGLRIQDAKGSPSADIFIDDVLLIPKKAVTNYTAVVADNNGCTASAPFQVPKIPEMILSLNNKKVSCYGGSDGSASVQVSGGTPPYRYSWQPYGETTSTIYNLPATTGIAVVPIYDDELLSPFVDWSWGGPINYQYDCGDRGKCISFLTPTEDDSAVWLYCDRCLDTSKYSSLTLWINGNVDGGQEYAIVLVKHVTTPASYTYMLYMQTVISLLNVTVIPQNKWLKVVYDFDALGVAFDSFDGFWVYNYFNSSQPLMLIDNVSLTKRPNTRSVTVTAEDFYSVKVTDVNNCVATVDEISVLQNPQLLPAGFAVKQASCFGCSDGNSTFFVKGGAPPYRYSWSHNNSLVGNSAIKLSAGSYNVSVVDSVGCKMASQSVTVLQPPLLEVDVDVDNAKCYGLQGKAHVMANGGVQPYYYYFRAEGIAYSETAQPLPMTVYIDNVSPSFSLSGDAQSVYGGPHSGYACLSVKSTLSIKSQNDLPASDFDRVEMWIKFTTAGYNGTVDVSLKSNDDVIGSTRLVADKSTVLQWNRVVCNVDSTSGSVAYIVVQASSQGAVLVDDVILIPREGSSRAQSVVGSYGVPPNFIAQVSGKNGYYSVLVLDSMQTLSTAKFNITQPLELVGNMTYVWKSNYTTVKKEEDDYVNVTVEVNGGTPPYRYIWSSLTTLTEVDGPVASFVADDELYEVTVIDANNCSITRNVKVPHIEYDMTEIIDQNEVLNAILGGIVGLCILISLAAAVVLVWKKEEFQEKSPLFCGLIVIGALVSNLAALVVLPERTDSLCLAFPWLLGTAFTLVYGCLFLKTWRLWGLLRAAKQLQRRVITNLYVVRLVAFYYCIELVVLIAWTVIDPPKAKYITLIDENKKQLQCEGDDYTFVFWGVFLGYKILWMGFGAFMAVKTRGIFEEYKESKQIAFSIYNCTVVAVVAIPLALILRKFPDATVVITVVSILICFTFTLAVLFGKIWMKILFGEEEQKVVHLRSRTNIASSSSTDYTPPSVKLASSRAQLSSGVSSSNIEDL